MSTSTTSTGTPTDTSAATATLDRWGRAALATVAVGGIYTVGRGLLPFGLACPLRVTTGVPCPLCGLTRLADALAQGDVARAVTVDPGGTVFLGLLVCLPVLALVARRASTPIPMVTPRVAPTTARRWSSRVSAAWPRSVVRALPIAVGLALLAHWLVVLRSGADIITR